MAALLETPPYGDTTGDNLSDVALPNLPVEVLPVIETELDLDINSDVEIVGELIYHDMDIALQGEEESNNATSASPPPPPPPSIEGAGQYSPEDWFPPPPSLRMMGGAGTLPEKQASSSMISPKRKEATPAFLEPCHFNWADDCDGQDRREQKLLAVLRQKDEELGKLAHFKMEIEAALERAMRAIRPPPGLAQTVTKRSHNGNPIVKNYYTDALHEGPYFNASHHQHGATTSTSHHQHGGSVHGEPASHGDPHQASQLGDSQQGDLQLRDGPVPARKLPRLEEPEAAESDWSMRATTSTAAVNFKSFQPGNSLR